MPSIDILRLQKLRPDVPHFQDDYQFACYCSFYLFAQAYCQNLTVLDAACGYGYGSRLLAETADSVKGVDISEQALAYATSHYAQGNLTFKKEDITVLDLPENSFDVLVSIETFEHFPPERTGHFIKAARRVLKPGGLLILSTPVREVYDQIAVTQDHINEVSAEVFMKLFRRHFTASEFYLARRNAMKSRQTAHSLSQKDRWGLRKMIPAQLRARLKRGLAGGLNPSFSKMLDYWQVHPAKDLSDLETAIFQIVVCRNSSS